MYRRTHFSEIWFCKEFYIGGIDVLSDSNRVFIRNIDINLSAYYAKFPYKYIKNAKMYLLTINRINFKIVIADLVNGARIISYITYRDFIKSVKANDDNSRRLNDRILRKFALDHVSKDEFSQEVFYIYSKDNSERYAVKTLSDCVTVQKQTFFVNPDATIDIPYDLVKSPYEFLGWYENADNVSVYGNIEDALKNIPLL